jgi:hypothetical protein
MFVPVRSLLILLACALVLYAAFPTRTYYWDGVLFALNIEDAARGQASPLALFHPNHLLYTAFGYMLYRAVLACGFTLRAITVLQGFNIIASIAATAVLYQLARRFTQAALFCATLFAFGATWWKFSTDADAYIVSILLLLLAVWFATATPPRWWAAALCHVGAMLFHELAIFAYPVILAAILLQRPRRIGLCAAYIAGTAACVAAAYWICYSLADHTAHPTLLAWATSFASDSGYTHSPGQIFGSLASYVKLFLGGRIGLIREYFSLASAAAFAVCVAALIASFFERSRATTRARNPLLWAWAIPYVIFLAVWDPGSAFHKLFVWPAIALLLAAYVPPRFAWAIALAAWNFGAFIYPHAHASADPMLVLAQKIDRELPKNATIYYAAFSPDDWYLDYFAPGRTWLKLSNPPAQGTVCFETTALATNPAVPVNRTWELVNPQHNIRLVCRIPPP